MNLGTADIFAQRTCDLLELRLDPFSGARRTARTILRVRHRPFWDQFCSGGRGYWCPPSCCRSHAGCKNPLPPLASRRRYAHSRALAGVVGKLLPGVSGEVSFRALDFDISLDLFLMVTT